MVLDRGFVVVYDEPEPSEEVIGWHSLRSATIRVWGTTNGLAELKDGPIVATVIDTVVERHTPERSVLDILVPTEKGVQAWKRKLSEKPR